MAAVAVVCVASALAADKGEVSRIGGPGTGQGEFSRNRGVAVSLPTGDVYVVDMGSVADGIDSRVQRFDADGAFVSEFGFTGTGKGQFGTVQINGPQGVAVDPDDGSVYVTDVQNRRVQKFSAAGAFDRMWGFGVKTGANAFEVCVASDVSCREGVSGDGPGQLATSGDRASMLAVHPVSGDVFVADSANRRINQYTALGQFLRGWGWDVDKSTTDNRFEVCTANCGAGVASTPASENGAFGTNQPLHLAIGDDGILYASDSSASNRVVRFDADAAPGSAGDATASLLAAIPSPGILAAGSTGGLAVDPSTGNLLVARGGIVQELEDPGAAVVDPVDFTHGQNEGYGPIRAIAVSGGGDVYASMTSPSEVVVVLNEAAPATATLNATTAITATSATLRATIDPNDADVRYRFQYRPAGGGDFTSVPAVSKRLAAGDADVLVSEQLSGLIPGSSYEVQLLVEGYGPDQVVGAGAEGDFSTPPAAPTVSQRPAAPVADTTAQLQAEVNSNNQATSYRFEWGTADCATIPNPCTPVPVPDADIGSGAAPLVVTQSLSGLDPETTYHFRVIAANGTGATTGTDQTFTTRPTPSVGPDSPRAYEMASPRYKVSGIGLGAQYEGPGSTGYAGQAAYERERFAAKGTWGSPVLDGALFSFANDWAFGERNAGNPAAGTPPAWEIHSPIRRAAYGDTFTLFYNLTTATADFETIVWGANKPLRLFPEMDGWPNFLQAYVGDWEGRVEVIGPTDPAQVPPPEVVGAGTPLFEAVPSADGDRVAASGPVVGLAGAGDPTHPDWVPAAVAPGTRNVYLDDVSEGIEDVFPGDPDDRRLISVCTGSGPARTEIPARLEDGNLDALPCPDALTGRDSRLVSDRGASLIDTRNGEAPGTSRANVVSADGSRVFFMSPDPADPDLAGPVSAPKAANCEGVGIESKCPTQVYVWQDNGDGTATTRWVSRAEEGLLGEQAASLTGAAFFEGASADGDKVFFRTASPLTADDPNGAGAPVPGGVKAGVPSASSWDLYMYDLPDDGDPGDGELTRITAGPDGGGDCNNPQGDLAGSEPAATLRFVSEDGGRAYFTCSAPLPGVGAPGTGTITSPGGAPSTTTSTNLYLYDASLTAAQRWRFIARVPRAIGGSGSADLDSCASTGATRRSFLTSFTPTAQIFFGLGPGSNCVNGTGDGAFVTLFTRGRLTEDDPDVVSGDIYGYDAEADELVRLTAAQGGVGGSYPCGTTGVAASVPCHGDPGLDSLDKANPVLGVATHPATAGDRVAFFESRARLVEDDVDEAYDVYEWRNGRLSLVSTGDSAESDGALYRGNDRSGTNVYFATRDRLTWRDVDNVVDVYTARVGGGIPEPVDPDLCDVLAGGCHGGGASPVPPGIGSPAPPGRGNPPVARPARVALGRFSAAQRRRAARSGVLRVRVRSSVAGRVTVVARGRVRGRVRRLGGGARRARRPGVVVVRVRLSRPARVRLRSGRRLRVKLIARAPGAHAKTRVVVLRRAGR